MNRIALAVFMTLAASSAMAQCNTDLLTVSDWSIKPIDKETNSLTVVLKSNADKPIRMIDGQYGFEDALGGHIASAAITRDAAIPPGGTYTETGRWGPYTFERLLTLKHDEVTPTICIRAVLFEDGTKEMFK